MDIFKQGGAFAAAQGHFIHAYVDRATQRPTEIPSAVRTKLEALLRELQLPLRS
jgi:acyl-CoA thioester hydrolase